FKPVKARSKRSCVSTRSISSICLSHFCLLFLLISRQVYLIKPVDSDELERTVQAFVDYWLQANTPPVNGYEGK
ncbi:hypothetical protein NDI45_17735, partial [Leptolyngbya sp. GB1-A1]